MNNLPLIHEDATSRAEKKGFDTSKIWYHGSRAQFKTFKRPKPHIGIQELGLGIYLTSRWNTANAWAGHGGHVYRCFVRKGPVFDKAALLTDEVLHHLHNEHSSFMRLHYGDAGAYDYVTFIEQVLKLKRCGTSIVPTYGSAIPNSMLQKAGYVGAVNERSQIQGQIVVFDRGDVFIAERGEGGSYRSVDESADEDEDAYLAKHKTGNISSSAYAGKEMPSSMHLYPVEKVPVVIGTMPLKNAVDGLAGASRKGTSYKEMYALVRKTLNDVAAIPSGPDGIHASASYPEWFRDVHYPWNGDWRHFRCTVNEIPNRSAINDRVVRSILWDDHTMSANDVGNLLDRPEEPTEGKITFRQSGERNRYVAHGEDGEIRRDADGSAVMMTPEEIEAKGLPAACTSVYAYDGPHCVGYACNEFGAVGVYVEQNYQRQGIGKELLRLYLKQYRREVRLGQMTPAGEQLTRSYYRSHVAPSNAKAVIEAIIGSGEYYGDSGQVMPKPLKDTDVIRVYHGFNVFRDALDACAHGLSGKERAKRIYSYENNNNPNGLFVTADLKIAKGFTSSSDEYLAVIEFHAKVSDLEAPVWPGGSYTVQGGLEQYFDNTSAETHHADREKERLAARERAKEFGQRDWSAYITQSDRPELARMLYQSREQQALFIGDLNPNMIRAVWVSAKGGRPYHLSSDTFTRMTRADFVAKFKQEIKGRKYLPYGKNPQGRLYDPAENWGGVEDFIVRLAADSNQSPDFFRSAVDSVIDSGDLHSMESYLWPKQMKQAATALLRHSAPSQ